MRHATIWAAAYPSLTDVIDQQGFANLVYLAGLAAGNAPHDAGARQQHAFMRSAEGHVYPKLLYDNLDLHKSLMETYQ